MVSQLTESVVWVFGEFASHDECHVKNEQCNDDIANRGGQPSRRQHLVNTPQHEGHRRDEPLEELNGMHADSGMKRKPRQTNQNQRNGGGYGMKAMGREMGEAIQKQKQCAGH